jgi:hypothetical protein
MLSRLYFYCRGSGAVFRSPATVKISEHEIRYYFSSPVLKTIKYFWFFDLKCYSVYVPPLFFQYLAGVYFQNTEILLSVLFRAFSVSPIKNQNKILTKLRHQQMHYILVYDKKNTITSLLHFFTQHVSMSTWHHHQGYYTKGFTETICHAVGLERYIAHPLPRCSIESVTVMW